MTAAASGFIVGVVRTGSEDSSGKREDAVRQANPIAPPAIIRARLFDPRIRVFRSVLDKLLFHILASGSTLLTIAFSSHSLASLGRRFSRVSVSSKGSAQFRNAL
jgi:hypothetical protein